MLKNSTIFDIENFVRGERIWNMLKCVYLIMSRNVGWTVYAFDLVWQPPEGGKWTISEDELRNEDNFKNEDDLRHKDELKVTIKVTITVTVCLICNIVQSQITCEQYLL